MKNEYHNTGRNRNSTHLPSRCRENMLVSLIITSLNHLSGMRLVLLLRGIGHESNIVVNIEVEERTRFSTGFVDDEVIKRMVLDSRTSQMHVHRGI